jgi:tetratricopeptide (TPR) repeat protein
LDNGLALLDCAVLLNPKLAAAWFLGGYLRAFRGETEGAIDHFNHALRLSPLDLEMFRMQAGIALAHFFARRFDVALRSLPSFSVAVTVLAASDAHRGQMQNAAAAVQFELSIPCYV